MVSSIVVRTGDEISGKKYRLGARSDDVAREVDRMKCH